MSTLTSPTRTGRRTELARYTLPTGEQRILYGQRVDGSVRITDNPAHHGGRAYLVERGLEHDGHAAVQAIVADYLQQAEQLEAIPASTGLLTRYLDRALNLQEAA